MSMPNSPEAELSSLATTIHTTIQISPTSQIRERLQICSSWFGSLEQARTALSSSSLIMELGCGQGDMTATIAGLTTNNKPKQRVLAVDPGALDYGSPFTLGEAQAKISNTPLGQKIEWIQAESISFIKQLKKEGRIPEFVILAHSLFYLPSETYLLDLLTALHDLSTSSGKPITLLLAEWGMRATHASAQTHIAAVKIQAKQATPDGNVRTLFYPETVKRIAKEAKWTLEWEGWVVPDEDVDDGRWEVATAKKRGVEGWRDEVKELEEMERMAGGKVRSMDVWSGVFRCGI